MTYIVAMTTECGKNKQEKQKFYLADFCDIFYPPTQAMQSGSDHSLA